MVVCYHEPLRNEMKLLEFGKIVSRIELRRQEMKILIALVAFLALVGMAAATDFPDWKITGKLSYSYVETATSDEANVAPVLAGTTSHASFEMPQLPESTNSQNSATGFVKNTLVSGTFGAAYLCDDPITQTLTQTGKANLVFEKDAGKEENVYTMDGSLFKAQEYDVKGQITSVNAQFTDVGEIGENYYGPFGGSCSAPLQSCGNLWAQESSSASGYVSPVVGAWMEDAWVGTASSTRVTMKVIDDLSGCQITEGPLLSGSSDAYAGFTDARIGQRDMTGAYIVTSAGVTTEHWLDNYGTEHPP
jgi:hypothetical protein